VNLQLEPQELAIQEQWRTFAREKLAPLAEQLDLTGELPAQLPEILRSGNLLKPFLPVELGGEGQGLFPLVLGLEEVARVAPVVGILCAQQAILGIRAMNAFANHPDKQARLREAAGFEKIYALAATEIAAGSDLSAMETALSGSPESGYTVKGGKAYVNWAARAGYLVLLASTPVPVSAETAASPAASTAASPAGGTEKSGKTMICLSLPHPGVKVGAVHKTMGLGGIEASPLEIDASGVMDRDLLGVRDFGQDVYDRIMNEMRIAMAAVGVGISQAAYDVAAGHAKARKQFGKAIGSFQSLQWRFADAAVRIEAARLHAWRAVEVAGSKLLSAKQAAMAKIFATESAFWVTDFAVQVMGSKGFLLGNPVERLFRDSRFLRLGHGTSEVLRNLIAAHP
jgi:alkylation response protein AidB-like acyl-CoA dehydrogenase